MFMAAEPLAFEDLHVGDEWISGSHEVSMSEIREFADLTGDYNAIHLDEEYAKKTPFGKPIAHGLLGLAWMAGLSTIAPWVRTTALLSIHGWRFRKPVFVGDTLRVVTQVAEIREHGRRHGEVHWYQRLINQKDDVVQDGMLTTLVERRVKAPARQRDLVRVDSEASFVGSRIPEPHLTDVSTTAVAPAPR
jgi:3-hydroxybutyryl-CoA dehydratase